MLTGKELGKAIDEAIKRKLQSGAVKTKVEIAKHFGIQPPSIHDWIKKGSISKDKLPELFSYFSDVVGPEHWGLTTESMNLFTSGSTDQTASSRHGDGDKSPQISEEQASYSRVKSEFEELPEEARAMMMISMGRDPDEPLPKELTESIRRMLYAIQDMIRQARKNKS